MTLHRVLNRLRVKWREKERERQRGEGGDRRVTDELNIAKIKPEL